MWVIDAIQRRPRITAAVNCWVRSRQHGKLCFPNFVQSSHVKWRLLDLFLNTPSGASSERHHNTIYFLLIYSKKRYQHTWKNHNPNPLEQFGAKSDWARQQGQKNRAMDHQEALGSQAYIETTHLGWQFPAASLLWAWRTLAAKRHVRLV